MMIENYRLNDFRFKGQIFTWINKRERGVIKERIDKGLANMEWLEKFPRTQVINLPIVGSDHGPVLVDADYSDMKSPRQFKFEIIWMDKEECGQIIKEGWETQFK